MKLEFLILGLLYFSFFYGLAVLVWTVDEELARAAWTEVKRWVR